MKTKINLFVLVCFLAFSMVMSSYTSIQETTPQGISFTIKNDTDGNVRLYDGKGYYTINRGYTKKVNVDSGRKYYKGDKGRKGDFLFEVSSSFSGKTIKLSDYM